MNKATQEIRQKYLELIQNNFEQLETDLKSLRSSERIKAKTLKPLLVKGISVYLCGPTWARTMDPLIMSQVL